MNDILDVKISSLNPEINALFNASTMGTMQVAQATAQTGGDLFYITGYSVDQEGNIDIPFVGKVDVRGLTLNEAHSAVDEKVSSSSPTTTFKSSWVVCAFQLLVNSTVLGNTWSCKTKSPSSKPLLLEVI